MLSAGVQALVEFYWFIGVGSTASCIATCSARIANVDRESALGVAAEYVENCVRRATGDGD